jgi:hypothetical protein
MMTIQSSGNPIELSRALHLVSSTMALVEHDDQRQSLMPCISLPNDVMQDFDSSLT